MPRLKLALHAAAAVISGGLVPVLWMRVGDGALPLIYLCALIALTCILRIITLIR